MIVRSNHDQSFWSIEFEIIFENFDQRLCTGITEGSLESFDEHHGSHHAARCPQVRRRAVFFDVAFHQPVVDLVVRIRVVVHVHTHRIKRIRIACGQRLVVADSRADHHLVKHAQLSHLLEQWRKAGSRPGHDQHIRSRIQHLVDVWREICRVQWCKDRPALLCRVIDRKLSTPVIDHRVERAGRTDPKGIVRCDLHKGVSLVEQTGTHHQRILVACPAGAEGVRTEVVRRDLGGCRRLCNEDYIVFFYHRHHCQRHSRTDVADQYLGSFSFDQFSGLGHAHFRVAAVVLLDHRDWATGNFHRAVRGIFQSQVEALRLAGTVDRQRSRFVRHQANHQGFSLLHGLFSFFWLWRCFCRRGFRWLGFFCGCRNAGT